MTPEEKNDVKSILLDQLNTIHECNYDELMKNTESMEYYKELVDKVDNFLFDKSSSKSLS